MICDDKKIIYTKQRPHNEGTTVLLTTWLICHDLQIFLFPEIKS